MRPVKSLAASPRFRAFLVPTLILGAGLSGCSHKRSVLRPAYGTPIVAPAPAPAAACPPGRGAIITGPSAASEPFASPEITVPAPAAGPSTSAEPTSPPTYEPEPVVPTRISPPTPTDTGEREPQLDMKYSDPGPSGPSVTDPGAFPELTQPKTSRSSSTNRRIRPSSNRLSPVSYREAVRPFVDQPAELFQPTHADRPWRYVVLHHSAGSVGGYDRIDQDHRKLMGWQGCGYHFVIGNGSDTPDGKIEVAERWVNQKNGVHCRNGKNADVNEYGIGICLVGNFDDAPPTARQLAAAKALVAYLGTRYNIPTERIDTHADLADGPTGCPGKHFSMAKLTPRDENRRSNLAQQIH